MTDACVVTSHASVPWYEKMAWFLEAHFGPVEVHAESEPVLIVRVDGEEARVSAGSVSCGSAGLQRRVASVVEMAELTVF